MLKYVNHYWNLKVLTEKNWQEQVTSQNKAKYANIDFFKNNDKQQRPSRLEPIILLGLADLTRFICGNDHGALLLIHTEHKEKVFFEIFPHKKYARKLFTNIV